LNPQIDALSRDDTRLSGTAHEMLGKHVAAILKNNTASNQTLYVENAKTKDANRPVSLSE